MRPALRFLAFLSAALSVLAVAAWLFGRLITDRWEWSQFLSWVPTPAVLFPTLILLLASALSARLAGTPAHGRRAGARMRRLAAMVFVLAMVYMLVFEWRLANAVRPRAVERARSLRLLDWNMTAVERNEQITGPVGAQSPDLAILVNPHSHLSWPPIFESLPALPHTARENSIMVLSRFPILRRASFWMRLPRPADSQGRPETDSRNDPGRAMYLVLDTAASLGRATTVWVIDMPSDERLGRRELAQLAAAAIANWAGQEILTDEAGAVTYRPAGPGFPAPDIITGDFNIPRGSGSLSLLAPAMTNAFDQGGWGWCASWPRVGPIFHIDQTFVGPALRAARYRVLDPTFGYHRMQVADLTPAPP